MRWPESATDATHLRISWRRVGSSSWINGVSWFRDAEQAGLGGIRPGTTTEVMLVAVTPTGESPPGTAVVPAPAIPC